MKRLRRVRSLLLIVLALASVAHATPRVGARLPAFEIRDLDDRVHSTRELTGQQTFVLAITDSDAADAMRAWGRVADARLPSGVRRVNLVLLDLAFFVPTATARSQARSRTPASMWSTTWMDVHNDLADAAQLPESETPYAFALDGRGEVVAMAHAPVTAPDAEAIWEHLRTP